MRVVAFWAALAGFAAAAGLTTALVTRLLRVAEGDLTGAAALVGEIGLAAFTALAGLFLLIVAVTDRKV